MIEQYIFTLFWTVLFCLGWRIVTDKDNVLYFIRKPFEDAETDAEALEERIKLLLQLKNNNEAIRLLQRQIIYKRLIYYIGKPFVLCITCYGSLWGVSVFVALNGLHESQAPYLIINCLGAAFINTFIWKLYVRLGF